MKSMANKGLFFSIILTLLLGLIGCAGKTDPRNLGLVTQKEDRVEQMPLTPPPPVNLPEPDSHSITLEKYSEEEVIALRKKAAQQKEQSSTRKTTKHAAKESSNKSRATSKKSAPSRTAPTVIPVVKAAIASKSNTTPQTQKPEALPIDISTPYQARLESGWNVNGLKYITINGQRYSLEEILAYAGEGDSQSIFNIEQTRGLLLINLPDNFSLQIDFYPPNTPSHENFEEYHLQIFDKKGSIVQKEYIEKRLKTYEFSIR